MKTALKWAVSAALLAATLYLLDWPALAAAAARLTAWAFFGAVLLACAPAVPLAIRWYRLAGGKGDFYSCTGRYLYANLLSAVSPGSLGGDVYRFFAFRTPERGGATLIGVLVRERLLGLTSMLIGLLAGVVVMEFYAAYTGREVARVFGLAAACGLVILSLLPRLLPYAPIPERWRGPAQAALSAGISRAGAGLLGWSLLALVLWVAAAHYVADRLGIEIALPLLVTVVTAVELVRIVPITVQGVGLREGVFATLFGLFGYPPENGFVLGAVAYVALSVALIASGALGALMLGRRDEPA